MDVIILIPRLNKKKVQVRPKEMKRTRIQISWRTEDRGFWIFLHTSEIFRRVNVDTSGFREIEIVSNVSIHSYIVLSLQLIRVHIADPTPQISK